MDEDRQWLGRYIARIHNAGEFFQAKHRPKLTPETYCQSSLQSILSQKFIPEDARTTLEKLITEILNLLKPYFPKDLKTICLHGDCHPGNILWNQTGPHFLDFDDMVIAPPIQDLWMLFFGSEEEQRVQRESFFAGYEMFRSFDRSTLNLIEPLRTLRMIRHSAWIGERYEEAVFQRAFPYYREPRYWEGFLSEMKEQWSLLQELSWA